MKGIGFLEDLPTIVPIVLALIIFFGGLSWGLNRVNQVDSQVDMALKLLDIVDTFAQQGVLTKETFKNSCDTAKNLIAGYGFTAYIETIDAKNELSCTGEYCCMKGSVPTGKRTILVRAFPITVQDTSSSIPTNRLKKLVVVIWKEG